MQTGATGIWSNRKSRRLIYGTQANPEHVFGTLDFGSCDGVAIYVCDFKYGRGKAVEVVGNTQMLCYAIALYLRLKRERPDLAKTIEVVCLAIVQPRAGGAPVRQWTIPLGDLLYWAHSTFKPSVNRIVEGVDIPLTPSNACFWCAASFECPAYRKYRLQKSIDLFPDYDPDTEDLTEEMI